MPQSLNQIDIKESKLNRAGNLLDLLLIDQTTGKNLIWGTDSYEQYGKKFATNKQITPSLITGKYNQLIQPRAAKSIEKQQKRTKEKAEVFTPLNIVNKMNKAIDESSRFKRITKKNWQEYIYQIWLEVACGEGPFIVSRYDPTAQRGELIPLEKRVGFLDKKLQIISKYCNSKKDWLFWAEEAFKASYGYEWQGDNVLLARENLLYTFIDHHKKKFLCEPSSELQKKIAEIISWNIFQMDGLRHVVPMSCRKESASTASLFKENPKKIEEKSCEGCEHNQPLKHNGKYVKIMDWKKKQTVRFVDILNQPTHLLS